LDLGLENSWDELTELEEERTTPSAEAAAPPNFGFWISDLGLKRGPFCKTLSFALTDVRAYARKLEIPTY
jgi:hypothetical protein